MIELEHSVKKVESLLIVYLADLGPGDFLLLHLIWDEASIPMLERDLLDGVGAEHADEWDQIADREILYLT